MIFQRLCIKNFNNLVEDCYTSRHQMAVETCSHTQSKRNWFVILLVMLPKHVPLVSHLSLSF